MNYFSADRSSLDYEDIIIYPIMGWLSKIFKGSSHKISEGHYHGRYEGDTVQNEPSCSGVTATATAISCHFSLSCYFDLLHG